jgi:hypothetical protein
MVEKTFGAEEEAQVDELWARVFESSNRVLHQHQKYGFDGFAKIPRPNVHDLLITLKLVTAHLDALLTADLEYTQSRQLLNAKTQITNMEKLALALHNKSREDYDAAVEALDKQAVF